MAVHRENRVPLDVLREVAEIVARRWDGAGRPLSHTDGAIHHTHPVADRVSASNPASG
mgnify:CR=1 FL=1